MNRALEYAACWGGEQPARPRPRLVDQPPRAGDDAGSRSHDEGWPAGVGVPVVGDVAERMADRAGRVTPVTPAAVSGLTDRMFRHLTRHLGSITGAWSRDRAGVDLGFQVVAFAPGRIDGAVIFSTLGLSDYILDSPAADGHFRLELIMIAPERLRRSALPYVLGDFGRMIVAQRELPEIGAIVRNVPLLADLSTMDTLYLGRPPCFPPDFTRFRSGGLAVNIDWLLPVSAAEATFVEAEGWAAFEKLIFSRAGFDPVDYARPSMPL